MHSTPTYKEASCSLSVRIEEEFMKVVTSAAVALASLAVSSAAFSMTTSQAKACVDRFVAQALDGQPAEVRIKDRVGPLPLILRSELPIQLEAVEKSSGRTIATAVCHPKRGLVEVNEY
jgi:hypothetical protein